MTEICRRVPWDSEFFGFPIGQVQSNRLDAESAQAVEGWCRQNDIRCLYFLADANDPETVETAEQAGYHLADVRLVMGLNLLAARLLQPLPAGLTIRGAKPADIPALQKIAAHSFTLSRFYFDPGFHRQRCSDLYTLWIEKNVTETNSQVLVAEFQDQIAGFISSGWPAGGSTAKIGLLGVERSQRGHRIGLHLMEHCLAGLADHGIGQVEAVTQMRNIGAQRVNQRAGFITSAIQLWYHKWF